MNLATLKTLIQNYTENAETTFVSELDNMIKQAEERILRMVTLPDFRKNQTGSLTSGSRFLSTPSDFLSSYSLAVTDGSSVKSYLLFKDVNFMDEAFPASQTGLPQYYGLFDRDTFVLGPTPNGNFAVEVHYRHKPESITAASSGTSWLGDNAENALLYGCLSEAYTFMKGEQDMQAQYEQRFQESIARLSNLGTGLDRQDSYRSGHLQREVM